ncbi:hypothetical protein LTR10_023497 [Elasticomyces elasticus]|nr:hypothetical protein LTR10_023497 [Elasticomyces elasticus]KAK5031421.1 hypothetical protein LTR13_007749 [Exophiala sideris]
MLINSTFYILGRSAMRFTPHLDRLKGLNPTCNFVFLEAEISLLSEVDAACKQIMAAEEKVDYLYMSAGLLPLNGAEYTKEGLEMCMALSYYARMRMIVNLLPLLRQSPQPRVLSVLNGGNEQRMYDNDLDLKQHWSVLAAINHSTTMTSLSFERLAKLEPKVAFLHNFPGWVRTDIWARITAPDSSGIVWRLTLAAIQAVVATAMFLAGQTSEESGERQAYHLTSDEFGPGAWRIDAASKEVTNPGVLEQYEQEGGPEKVWDHTSRVFDRILAAQ